MAKEEPLKIYFDMDGVLADFESGVRELCGMEPQKQGRQSPRDDDLMFAAMSANGTSIISNIEQIDRGYENIEARLNALGAKIERI